MPSPNARPSATNSPDGARREATQGFVPASIADRLRERTNDGRYAGGVPPLDRRRRRLGSRPCACEGEVGPSTELAVAGSVDLAAILNEPRFGVGVCIPSRATEGPGPTTSPQPSVSGNGANARSMEVMFVRDPRSGLVDEIIALRDRGAPGGSHLLVCQLCGELAATGGWGGGLGASGRRGVQRDRP